MPRATSSATITFGLVSIPVKLYTAAASESVSFNMLSPAGNRLSQKMVDKVSGEEVARADTLKGYEYAKDQYVTFSADELKSLEAASDKVVDIKEFVELSSVDLLQVEKSYYLGPDKGGDKGYALLARTMKDMGKVAVAQWAARGKEQLVLVRPYKDGLVLHQMYYTNEVRDFEEIEVAKLEIAEAETEMAKLLVEKLATGGFDPSKYEDTYRKRVKEAVDQKVAGKEIVLPGPSPQKDVTDLFAQLKASLTEAKEAKAKAEPKADEKPKAKRTKKSRKPKSD